FSTAFGKILFHDFGGLLFERFVVGFQARLFRSVPEKYARHPRAFRAPVWSAQVLHFDLRPGNNVRCKSIPRVRCRRWLREGHGRVGDFGEPGPPKRLTNVTWESWTKGGHQMPGDCKNCGLCPKSLGLAVDLGFDLHAASPLLEMDDPRSLRDAYLRGSGLRNAINTVGEIPLAAHQEIPGDLHWNHARGGLCRTTHRTIQARMEDPVEHLLSA